MKVYLDQIIFNIQSHGGISVYFRELIKYYAANDVKFSLLASAVTNSFLRYFPLVANFKEPVIFHSSYYRVMFGRNVRNIVTVHDFTYELFGKGLPRRVHVLQKYLAMYFSEGIVCVSENTAADLKKMYPRIYKKKKVAVIYNGVSSDYKFLGDYNVTDYVLSVGSRSGYKNFESTLKAIVKTKLKLKIVGGGELTRKELDVIDALGLDGRIEYLRDVSNSDLNKLYNNALCLVYPSLYEGFGIPVVEAMRAGCRVIAHNEGAVPEIANGGASLVDCRDSKNIEMALREMSDCSDIKEIVDKNIEKSKAFEWNLCANATLSFYKRVLGI